MEGEQDPIILDVARKHGVDDDDMLHAFRNPMRFWDLDDGFVMYLGPAQDGQFLEVGVADGDDGQAVVHAMKARKKYLPRR